MSLPWQIVNPLGIQDPNPSSKCGARGWGQPWCESELCRSESVKAFIECTRAQTVVSTHRVFIMRSSMSAPEPLTMSAHLLTLIFLIKVSSLMTRPTITALISIYYRKEVTCHQAEHVFTCNTQSLSKKSRIDGVIDVWLLYCLNFSIKFKGLKYKTMTTWHKIVIRIS